MIYKELAFHGRLFANVEVKFAKGRQNNDDITLLLYRPTFINGWE